MPLPSLTLDNEFVDQRASNYMMHRSYEISDDDANRLDEHPSEYLVKVYDDYIDKMRKIVALNVIKWLCVLKKQPMSKGIDELSWVVSWIACFNDTEGSDEDQKDPLYVANRIRENIMDGINFNDDTEMPEDGEDLTWVLNESEFIRFCSVITHAKALINDSRHDVWNLGAKYVIPFADAEDQPIRDDWLSLKKYNRDGLLSKEYFNV